MAARVGSGHVLLCVTDHESAAATSELVNHLGDSGFQVKVILASGAKRFVKGLSLDQALDDEAEWYAWKKVGDDVLHIELTRWADMVIVVPCSANYLAKIANGLCDDLVMSVIRAWPPEKPLLVQLAMHEAMWKHPQTCKQLSPLNQQPNLYFVGSRGDVRHALDYDLDRPGCMHARTQDNTFARQVVSSIQQVLKGSSQDVSLAIT